MMYSALDLWLGLSVTLPAFLAYWFVPGLSRHRLGILSLLSFFWLAAISPRTFVVPFLGAFLTFHLARRLRREGSGPRDLALALMLPLGALLFYRYFVPLAAAAEWFQKSVTLVGLSYYSFKQMHFLIESQRGKFAEVKFDEYLLYLIYFPMFIAGPIERMTNFHRALPAGPFALESFSAGVERILLGLFKKLIVADLFLASLLPGELAAQDVLQLSCPRMLLVAFCRFLYVYMDFSGYADLAVGISLLFGVRLMENFNRPLLQANLADFWRCWHISLSSWARDYVYFPVLGRFRAPSAALLLTMLTIGAWHGLQPGWLLWGLHHGLGLAVLARYHQKIRPWKRFNRMRQSRPFKFLGILTVWYYVSAGGLLAMFPGSMADSLALYRKAMTFGLW
jgi:alginate O-acetyltransferase complex protein AlgI